MIGLYFAPKSIILKEQTSKEMAVPGDWVVIAKLQA
jgi:hypothetical protein